MQQTVRLLGDLGERYGSEHKYHDLRSPAEAIKLLSINYPALQKELVQAHEHGVGYTLVQAETFLGYEDLHLPLGSNDLVLTPVVAGSGGSTTQILVGVGLVAASFLLPGAGLFGTTSVFGTLAAGSTAAVPFAGAIGVAGSAFGTALGTALSAIGASLVLGGVSQMLAPQPEVPSLNNQNRTKPGENTNATGPQGVSRATSGEQSYAFSGPANTVGVGATVPLVYGKLLIGSHLLSAKVAVTSESDPTGEFFTAPGPSSITINGEKPDFKFKSHNGLRTRRWNNDAVRIQDLEIGGEFKRKVSADVLRYDNRDQKSTSGIKDYDQDDNEFGNLQVFFEINKGLSRVIGNQTVPAFVTYEITVKKDNYDGDSPVFTNVRGTIQGLLKETESYKWCHAVTVGVSGVEDNDTEQRVRYRIIDTDADNPNGQIVIRGVGYDHFYNQDENETEDLVSED